MVLVSTRLSRVTGAPPTTRELLSLVHQGGLSIHHRGLCLVPGIVLVSLYSLAFRFLVRFSSSNHLTTIFLCILVHLVLFLRFFPSIHIILFPPPPSSPPTPSSSSLPLFLPLLLSSPLLSYTSFSDPRILSPTSCYHHLPPHTHPFATQQMLRSNAQSRVIYTCLMKGQWVARARLRVVCELRRVSVCLIYDKSKPSLTLRSVTRPSLALETLLLLLPHPFAPPSLHLPSFAKFSGSSLLQRLGRVTG